MDGNLWVTESHQSEEDFDEDGDARRGYMLGDPFTYETFTDDPGTLFRNMQREYGRATKMYVDGPNPNEPKQVGWVFAKMRPYEDDASKSYRHIVWVEVFTVPPEYNRVLVEGTGLHPWS